MDRRPMVVELQRDPDDIVALLAEQACHHGGIYAAGHGDDDTCLVRGLGEVEGVHHVTGSPAGRSARICGVYSDPGVELPGTREAGLAYRSTEPGNPAGTGTISPGRIDKIQKAGKILLLNQRVAAREPWLEVCAVGARR